jgi:cell wall assembly regulator SMI1
MSAEPVVEAWQRIVHWLRTAAPASHAALLPTTAGAADLVQLHTGTGLRPDLRQYWETVGGTDRSWAAHVFPHGRVLSADEAITQALMRLEVYNDLAQDDPDMRRGTRRAGAGEMAWSWEREFLPISDDTTGDGLFADLRPGALHGCIKHWSHEEGALHPPLWSGVVAMLEDIAFSLEHGTACQGWEPTVSDGSLRWEFPGSGVVTSVDDGLTPELRERLFPSGRGVPVAEPDQVDLRYMTRMRALGPDRTPGLDGLE